MSSLRRTIAWAMLAGLILSGCRAAPQGTPASEPASQPATAAKKATKAAKKAAKIPGAPAASKSGSAPTLEAVDEELPAQFQADLATLTKNPHRLAGYPDGSRAAGDYVEQRLRDIGVQEIYSQEFPVVQPLTTECKLAVDGKDITGQDVLGQDAPVIYPCRPNILQACVTPEEGLTGQTLYAAKGEIADFGGELLQGKIAVMDFDCGNKWQRAFAFGATAVVFVGGDAAAAEAVQHINVPSNFPRFYISEAVDARLGLRKGSHRITIRAACDWKPLLGRNVIAVIRGTGTERPAQAVVLAAALDSYSEVPELAPGARDAANCAGLLAIADYLQKDPSARDVILCFFDGQTLNHLGARAFYGALCRQRKGLTARTLEDSKKDVETELAFRQAVLRTLDAEDIFNIDIGKLRQQPATAPASPGASPDTPEAQQKVVDLVESSHREILRVLRADAESLTADVLEKLRPLRVQKAEYEREQDKLEKSLPNEKDAAKQAEIKARLAQLSHEIENLYNKKIKPLEDKDKAWNEVQRGINRQRMSSDKDVQDRFADLRSVSRKNALLRIAELRQMQRRFRQEEALLAALGAQVLPAEGRDWIVLHVAINLGDARQRWAFVHGDDSAPGTRADDKPGNYAPLLRAFRDIYQKEPARWPGFEVRATRTEYDVRWFAPAKFVDSTDVAKLFAVSNVSIMTVLDRLPRQGQPADTVAALNVPTMLTQLSEVMPFLRRALDHADVALKSKIAIQAWACEPGWGYGKSEGATVNTSAGGKALADMPVPGAVVAMVHHGGVQGWGEAVNQPPPGFVYPIIVMSNRNGNFEIPPCSSAFYPQPAYFAALFDRKELDDTPGSDRYATRGIISAVTAEDALVPKTRLETKLSIVLFRTKFLSLAQYGVSHANAASLAMRAKSSAEFRKDRRLLCEFQDVTTLYAPEDAKTIKLVNLANMFVLDNQPTKDDYLGIGLPVDDPFFHPVATWISRHDLLALNQYRLDLLRQNGIMLDSLEVIHGAGKDLSDEAQRQLQSAQSQPAASVGIERITGEAAASLAYSHNVYGPLVGVMKDLVTAVVLLLLLAMPFAFALERLLIGTPHIYRQIGWFGIFFAGTFVVLYFVNPAFRIAATPSIIFLAFAIILLSSLVIFIMVRKLQTEIKKMQGMAVSLHAADVSRLSTMMAAVSMGISTMRRRPVRTLLTSVTVVLLTFTILTFASFGNNWGINKAYKAPMTGSAPQIMIRQQLWGEISNGVYDRLRGALQGEAKVVGRYWLAPLAAEAAANAKNGEQPQILLASDSLLAHPYIAGPDGKQDFNHFLQVSAAVGVDLQDLVPADSRQKQLADVLKGRIELLGQDGIFITSAQQERLGLDEKDIGSAKVYLSGVPFTFAGIIQDQASAVTALEGSSVLPVDYQASGGEGDAFTKPDQEMMNADSESARFVPFNLDNVVIIPAEMAKRIGGRLRSLSVYPLHGTQGLDEMAEKVAYIAQLPTYEGLAGVHRLLFMALASASGWKDLLIPVLLGGLIVFATMLGSVSDREREIYTFSSLGLAPPHIASLFFAEASMYAVVGGMGGYLLGQIVTRVLGFLSDLGYISVPRMNYSSTNAIITILIVMSTVLISTIYPAVKASGSANPGVQRHWRIPKPKADLYDLVFPFTVSAYDIIGVVSFLKEHFDNYSDAALGAFACIESHILRQRGNDMLGFSARVALAPFDLGVTQNFAILSQPSDIQGIDEIRILIYRLSGAHGDWQRSNRVFINDLRKQLLIWRSLTAEIMEKYRQKTLEQWDRLPVEDVTESVSRQASSEDRTQPPTGAQA